MNMTFFRTLYRGRPHHLGVGWRGAGCGCHSHGFKVYRIIDVNESLIVCVSVCVKVYVCFREYVCVRTCVYLCGLCSLVSARHTFSPVKQG